MEKSKEKDTRSCLERLLPAGKQRYKEKLLDIQGNDPYKIPAKSWSTDPENFPDIESVGIFSYFVLNVSYYTSEQFRAYRSLAAYKTFVAGWVRDIKTYKPGGCENIVVTAKVSWIQSEVVVLDDKTESWGAKVGGSLFFSTNKS